MTDLTAIYRADYLGSCKKHKWKHLEGEKGVYECSKCGSMGGWCWRCGNKVYGKKQKAFCRDCAKEIKEQIK